MEGWGLGGNGQLSRQRRVRGEEAAQMHNCGRPWWRRGGRGGDEIADRTAVPGAPGASEGDENGENSRGLFSACRNSSVGCSFRKRGRHPSLKSKGGRLSFSWINFLRFVHV